MTDIKKEFDTFEEYLKIHMKVIKVRDITRRFFSDTTDHEYDELTIEQFLVLYKLNRMEELGIIKKDVASYLKELLDMKMHIGTIIGEEAKRKLYDPSYNSNDLEKLHKMSETIDKHLKKYHLTIEDINLNEMLESSIKKEQSKTVQNNNTRIKRIG